MEHVSVAEKNKKVLPVKGRRNAIVNRVYIAGFTKKTTEKEIRHKFESFGDVLEVNIISNRYHHYCFVTFANVEDCQRLLRIKDEFDLKLVIRPAFYEPRRDASKQCIGTANQLQEKNQLTKTNHVVSQQTGQEPGDFSDKRTSTPPSSTNNAPKSETAQCGSPLNFTKSSNVSKYDQITSPGISMQGSQIHGTQNIPAPNSGNQGAPLYSQQAHVSPKPCYSYQLSGNINGAQKTVNSKYNSSNFTKGAFVSANYEQIISPPVHMQSAPIYGTQNTHALNIANGSQYHGQGTPMSYYPRQFAGNPLDNFVPFTMASVQFQQSMPNQVPMYQVPINPVVPRIPFNYPVQNQVLPSHFFQGQTQMPNVLQNQLPGSHVGVFSNQVNQFPPIQTMPQQASAQGRPVNPLAQNYVALSDMGQNPVTSNYGTLASITESAVAQTIPSVDATANYRRDVDYSSTVASGENSSIPTSSFQVDNIPTPNYATSAVNSTSGA